MKLALLRAAMEASSPFEHLDPYVVLGVERSATAADIKSACKPQCTTISRAFSFLGCMPKAAVACTLSVLLYLASSTAHALQVRVCSFLSCMPPASTAAAAFVLQSVTLCQASFCLAYSITHFLCVSACPSADRRKALRVHPDKHHGNEQAAEAAAEEFRQLSWANAILSDPDKRRRYDAGSWPVTAARLVCCPLNEMP